MIVCALRLHGVLPHRSHVCGRSDALERYSEKLQISALNMGMNVAICLVANV